MADAATSMQFFGGRGFQAAIGWDGEAAALEPIFTCTGAGDGPGHWYEIVRSGDGAINRGLRFLGDRLRDFYGEVAAAGHGTLIVRD